MLVDLVFLHLGADSGMPSPPASDDDVMKTILDHESLAIIAVKKSAPDISTENISVDNAEKFEHIPDFTPAPTPRMP